ncbi:unnamed protein product, partial [marine sediment metagenome]
MGNKELALPLSTLEKKGPRKILNRYANSTGLL